MRELIRHILREERSSTQKIKDLISKHGLIREINAVGGFKNLKKTLGNDIDDVLSGIEPPYFQTFSSYYIDNNLELSTEIFSYIFSEPVRVSPFGQTIANENGNPTVTLPLYTEMRFPSGPTVYGRNMKIKTKRLTSAIIAYYEFKRSHTNAMIAKCCHDTYEKIKDEVLSAAHAEKKSCAIVPGTIVITTKKLCPYFHHSDGHIWTSEKMFDDKPKGSLFK